MPTANLALDYLANGQNQKEVLINANMDLIDAAVAVVQTEAKQGGILPFFMGFTPTGTGADVVEIPAPYGKQDGVTSYTYDLRRLNFHVPAAGVGTTDCTVVIEKSHAGGSFASIGTITLPGTDADAHSTSSLGTFVSGDILRANVTALGDALNWTVTAEFQATS